MFIAKPAPSHTHADDVVVQLRPSTPRNPPQIRNVTKMDVTLPIFVIWLDFLLVDTESCITRSCMHEI